MVRVEIYTSEWCPYCYRAKHLLQKKGVTFEEIVVDGDPELRMKMAERAGGRSTVPQIFIDGRPIGGCDDLYALDGKGRLDPLLQGPA